MFLAVGMTTRAVVSASMIDWKAFLQGEVVMRLFNGGVDGNSIDNGVVENGGVEFEGGNVGTGDVDNFEGIYLTPFLTLKG
jgi:hypothetical protein